MRKLPSRGWGPWRREFYSFHSSMAAIEADTDCKSGHWRNVWVGRVSKFVYGRWPKLWVWAVNLPIPNSHRRALRRCFPNLK